jgi:hypothetical protein
MTDHKIEAIAQYYDMFHRKKTAKNRQLFAIGGKYIFHTVGRGSNLPGLLH